MLGVALVAAPVSIFAQAQSTPEIFKSLLGKQLAFETPAGVKSTGSFAANGSAAVASGGLKDTGKWRLTSDSFCITWVHFRGGSETCLVIVPDGKPGQYLFKFKDTGGVSSKVTVQ